MKRRVFIVPPDERETSSRLGQREVKGMARYPGFGCGVW